VSPLILKTGIAGLAKASAAIFGFLVTAAVTRTLGATEAGLFLFGFSLLSASSKFFRLGLDSVILRWIGAEGASSLAQEKLNRGLIWIILVSVPATILVALLADIMATSIFGKPALGPVLRWMILALPFMTVFMVIGMAFQGQHKVIIATIFQQLGMSSLFLSAFAVIWWQAPRWLDAANLGLVYALTASLVCACACWLWYRQPGMQKKIKALRDTELWSASSNLWVASSMGLLVQWSGIIVAGAIITSEDMAYLTAAQRTAALTSFVLMVVNMVVAPRYARLWKEQNINEIQRLARLSTRGMLGLAMPVVGVMVLFPQQVMLVFGEGFDEGALLLIIMALGQFINVATGSVGFLLNMSGHERDMRRVTMFSGPLTMICALVFTLQWGVLGAATATALGLSVQNLLALGMVKKRMGFWPIGW
jgi:O-antigen/teichoic acid export membrane protein